MFDAVFSMSQQRLGQGQVKKGEILNFINVNQKGVYQMQMQFELRNSLVSFVLLYDV